MCKRREAFSLAVLIGRGLVLVFLGWLLSFTFACFIQFSGCEPFNINPICIRWDFSYIFFLLLSYIAWSYQKIWNDTGFCMIKNFSGIFSGCSEYLPHRRVFDRTEQYYSSLVNSIFDQKSIILHRKYLNGTFCWCLRLWSVQFFCILSCFLWKY